MLRNSFFLLYFLGSSLIYSQNELDDILNQQSSDSTKAKEYVNATFKGTKLINGHNVESPSPGVLQFIIYHRFGTLKDPLYNFLGLDNATIRIALDYGISKRLSVGIGRTVVLKAVDVYAKYKLLMQTTDNSTPISMVLVGGSSYNAIRLPYYKEDGIRRLNYLTQLLIAKKISSAVSLQLMPTMVYNNLSESPHDNNMVFSAGYGGRFKLNKRTSLNWEHFVLLPNQLSDNFRSTVALGFDIETGGHVFQLHFTNATSMIEQQFVSGTIDDIFKGDIRFGFNISRVFTINNNAKR